MESEQLKQWLYDFFVYAVDAGFALPFREDEGAFLQRLQVVADHALFLAEGFGEFGDVFGSVFHQKLCNRQSGGVGEGGEEAVASFV